MGVRGRGCNLDLCPSVFLILMQREGGGAPQCEGLALGIVEPVSLILWRIDKLDKE